MKNFVQNGAVVTVAAPYDVASGAGALVGSLFGVAQAAALSGADVSLARTGAYALAKAGSQTWAVGARIYWDNTAKNCTTTSTANTLIGVALVAAASADTTGTVLLDGAAR